MIGFLIGFFVFAVLSVSKENPNPIVKYGKWIADDCFDNGKSSCFHCSECSSRYAPPVLITSEKLSESKRYCETCGAKCIKRLTVMYEYNPCDICAEMGAIDDCENCYIGNPCLGCEYYDKDCDGQCSIEYSDNNSDIEDDV